MTNWSWLYVAALYALGVLLIRKGRSLQLPVPVAAFFYAVVLVFLFKPLTGPYINVPADFARGLHPWRTPHGPHPSANDELNDVILQQVPWAHQVRTSWMSGEAPLWNAATGGGYPLLANAQSAAFSFFRWATLGLPLGFALSAEAALKLLVALTGTFLYMRRRRFSGLTSTITALVYGFSTHNIVFLHFQNSSVAVFIPWLFLAIDMMVDRASARRFAFAAVIFAALILHGQPETAAHVVIGAIAYSVFATVTSRSAVRVRGLLLLAGAGIAGLALAAPMALPFFEMLPYSVRDAGLQLVDVNARREPMFLVPFVNVGFFGFFGRGTLWGPGDVESITGYAGILAIAGAAYVALMLARRRAPAFQLFYFFSALGLLAIIMNWRWTFLGDLLHQLPFLSKVNPGRMRVVLCWFAAVLAGIFVEAVIDAIHDRARRIDVLLSTLVASVLLALPFVLNDVPTDTIRWTALTSAMPRIIAIALLLVALAQRKRKAAAALIGVAVLVDLWSFGTWWNPVIRDIETYRSTPLIQKLAWRSVSQQPFRFTATGGTFFPNSAAMYDLEDVRVHDPMANFREVSALRVYDEYDTSTYFAMLRDIDFPFLDFMNVRYVVTSPYEDLDREHFTLIHDNWDGKIFENTRAMTRFFIAENPIVEPKPELRRELMAAFHYWSDVVVLPEKPDSLLWDSATGGRDRKARIWSVEPEPGRYVVHTRSKSALVVTGSVAQFPGWKITSDGRPLPTVTANGGFLAFIVPPGDREVNLSYDPASFKLGCALALCTALALLAATLREWRRSGRDARRAAPGTT